MSIKEQKLVDICFQIGLVIHNQSDYFKDLSSDETADWIANQLRWCGFPTEPVGCSHGVLIK